MLAAASRWLDATLAASEGETVGLRIGGAPAVSITDVSFGATEIGSEVSPGVLQTWHSVDAFIPAADYTLGGQPVEPEVGHLIERTVGSDTVVYQVSGATDGRCFRFTDPVTREMYRIHTKEVAGE